MPIRLSLNLQISSLAASLFSAQVNLQKITELMKSPLEDFSTSTFKSITYLKGLTAVMMNHSLKPLSNHRVLPSSAKTSQNDSSWMPILILEVLGGIICFLF